MATENGIVKTDGLLGTAIGVLETIISSQKVKQAEYEAFYKSRLETAKKWQQYAQQNAANPKALIFAKNDLQKIELHTPIAFEMHLLQQVLSDLKTLL